MEGLTYLGRFIETVRNRSAEHQRCFDAVYFSRSTQAGLIRFELDSLLRASYLCRQNLKDREKIASEFFETGHFVDPDTGKRITDRKMVDLVDGWVSRAYTGLNGFAHLSYLHEGTPETDLTVLLGEDAKVTEEYLEYYHGRPIVGHLKLASLESYFQEIFVKVLDNTLCYVKDLEQFTDPDHII